MSRSSPRLPQQLIPMDCEHCKRDFRAFRKSARYCSDACRAGASVKRLDKTGREAVIAANGPLCHYCAPGRQKGERVFVRFDHRIDQRVVLCGHHNGLLSASLFAKAHPEAGPGYSSRTYLLRKQAAEKAEIEAQTPSIDAKTTP